ncbi:programmed cell death protein 6-like [Corticium candelabrum]|uniref:programmed cell death protein 6-like n=1 Tax=Corticium candelabrum TaxID=121492 RepID=UPI002E273D2C|nr:programmed cell death protein 6-like [Corticium candelabrum]
MAIGSWTIRSCTYLTVKVNVQVVSQIKTTSAVRKNAQLPLPRLSQHFPLWPGQGQRNFQLTDHSRAGMEELITFDSEHAEHYLSFLQLQKDPVLLRHGEFETAMNDVKLWYHGKAVDADQSGGISAQELRQALVNGNWSHFNPETCRLMIGMFDKDKSGTIDIYEFSALWKYIQEWKQCFDSFDRDRSGTIDAGELNQAFSTFGYRLSMEFSQLCVRLFDRSHAHTMKLDDFIQCCVMLKSMTDAFRGRDIQQQGVITISYEQFMEMALDNTLS